MKTFSFLAVSTILVVARGYVLDTPKGNVVPFVKGSRSATRSDSDISITFDYDTLFEKIQNVSPLAKLVMKNSAQGQQNYYGGMDTIPPCSQKWKTVEKKSGGKGPVKQVQKLESFNSVKAPLLRFRGEISGPCVGELFGQYILDLDSRKKWDAQIDNVFDIHGFDDLDPVNIAMGFGRRYGDLTKMGIGYTQTKAGIVSPREQMFLYGMQKFPDGACVLWGSELDDKYNFLLPPGTRHTRARSHLFAATLVPTGPDMFDIEYVLQLEVGGGVPTFMTTPVVIDTVKKMFKTVDADLGSLEGEIDALLGQEKTDLVAESLLMTP